MLRTTAAFILLTSSLVMTRPLPVGADVKYSIKEMTPEVTAALENRRNRYEKLREIKSQGIIGENNRGYVELLVDDQAAKTLLEAENKDRKVIYQTIADQNGLTNALATIEKVFAQEQRERAQPGEKIQTEDGQWVVKAQ